MMNHRNGDDDGVPYFQKLFDRPFLWLGMGFGTMVLFYTIWGLIDIFSLPKSPLP